VRPNVAAQPPPKAVGCSGLLYVFMAHSLFLTSGLTNNQGDGVDGQLQECGGLYQCFYRSGSTGNV